jgi:hypothetical protein
VKKIAKRVDNLKGVPMTTNFTIIPASPWGAHPGLFEFSTETADRKGIVTSGPIPTLEQDEQVIGSFKQGNNHFVCVLNTEKLIHLYVDFATKTVDTKAPLKLFPYSINLRNNAAVPRQIEPSASNPNHSKLLWCQEYQKGPQRMLAVAYATYATATKEHRHSNLLISPLDAQANWQEHYHIEVLSSETDCPSIITKYRSEQGNAIQVWQKEIDRSAMQFRSAHPNLVLLDNTLHQYPGEFEIRNAETGDPMFFAGTSDKNPLKFPAERCFNKGNVFVLRAERPTEKDILKYETVQIVVIEPGVQTYIYHLAPEDQADLYSWDEVADISEMTGSGLDRECEITGYKTLPDSTTIKEKIVKHIKLREKVFVPYSGPPGLQRSFLSYTWPWALPVLAILSTLAYFFKSRFQKLWA